MTAGTARRAATLSGGSRTLTAVYTAGLGFNGSSSTALRFTVSTTTPASTATGSRQRLPFTGSPTVPLTLTGTGLISAGAIVRSLARRRGRRP